MKKLLFRIVLAIAIVIQLSGCKTQMVMSNGAFSDISLVRESKDYNIKRLEEITTEGRATFGIPVDKSPGKKQGIVFRFNGINLSATRGVLPIISLIGISVTTGFIVSSLAGLKQDKVKVNDIQYNFTETSADKYVLGFGTSGKIVPIIIGSIIGIPIAGAINNQIWSGAAYNRAAYKFNTKLLEDNPDIDVFLNPKYDIERRNGLWTQHAKFKGKVMGATIKVD